MSTAEKTVLIVDDQPELRALIREVIEGCGYVVVGEAGTGSDGVRLARELHPDVITMDLEMPQMNGAEATRTICSDGRATAVVIVSGSRSSDLVGAAIAAGARWHIAKHDLVEQLPHVLRSLLGAAGRA